MKKLLLLSVKIIISLGLFYLLFTKVPLEEVKTQLTQVNVYWLLVAVLAYTLSTFISAWRWSAIAKSLHISLSYFSALKLYYVGSFFNQLLPSGIGGDAVKAVALAKRHAKKSAAVHSVLFERLAGLGVLIGILAVVSPVVYRFFEELAWLVWGLSAATFVGIGFFFILKDKTQMLEKRKATKWLAVLFKDVEKSFLSLSKFSFQLLTSLAVQLLSIFMLYCCARSIGVEIDFIYVLSFAPLMFLLLVLPVSLAGWGVREAVSVGLFAVSGLMSQADALTMSLLFGVMVVLASLPGGLFLFKYSK